METPHRAGYNRGSADKLANRPYDKTVPAKHKGDAKSYRSGYRKGFKGTDSVGLEGGFGSSFSVNLSASSSSSSTPSAPAAPAAPTMTLLKSVSLLQPQGFSAVLPDATIKAKWTDVEAAVIDLDRKVAKFEAEVAADKTKDVTTWGPKNESFVTQWRTMSTKIRLARAMRNEITSAAVAEQEIMKARAAFAIIQNEWSVLPPARPKLAGMLKRGDAASPLGGAPAKEPEVSSTKDAPSTEQVGPTLPEPPPVLETRDLKTTETRDTSLTTSPPSWFEENWKWVALGAVVVAGGGYAYYSMRGA